MTPAIDIRNLNVFFDEYHALADISLAVAQGDSFGLVGESGSGKSTLLRAVTGLAPMHSGAITVNGEALTGQKRSRDFYRQVQMVFQDPYASLHPRQTVDRLLLEPLMIHGIDGSEQRIRRVLDEVGLGASFRFRYPHQMSGGQRQRIAIARVLVVEPQVLLLDEPTSALDASVQAEVLNLLQQVRRDRGLTFVMVSHDLGVVTHMCNSLAVMQQGRVVEALTADDLAHGRLQQDYTRQLMTASAGFVRKAG